MSRYSDKTHVARGRVTTNKYTKLHINININTLIPEKPPYAVKSPAKAGWQVLYRLIKKHLDEYVAAKGHGDRDELSGTLRLQAEYAFVDVPSGEIPDEEMGKIDEGLKAGVPRVLDGDPPAWRFERNSKEVGRCSITLEMVPPTDRGGIGSQAAAKPLPHPGRGDLTSPSESISSPEVEQIEKGQRTADAAVELEREVLPAKPRPVPHDVLKRVEDNLEQLANQAQEALAAVREEVAKSDPELDEPPVQSLSYESREKKLLDEFTTLVIAFPKESRSVLPKLVQIAEEQGSPDEDRNLNGTRGQHGSGISHQELLRISGEVRERSRERQRPTLTEIQDYLRALADADVSEFSIEQKQEIAADVNQHLEESGGVLVAKAKAAANLQKKYSITSEIIVYYNITNIICEKTKDASKGSFRAYASSTSVPNNSSRGQFPILQIMSHAEWDEIEKIQDAKFKELSNLNSDHSGNKSLEVAIKDKTKIK